MAQAEQAIHIFPDIEKGMGFSAGVRANGMLYMSGMIAIDAAMNIVGAGDMYAQVMTIYETLARALAEQGLSLKNVVKETVFVTSLAAMETGRTARAEAYSRANAYPPASTMVEVKALFAPEVMVEIEIIAQT